MTAATRSSQQKVIFFPILSFLFLLQPHRCDQCSQTFNVEFNLTLHRSTHTTSDFTCPVCNKKFSRIASLKSHIMLHEKEEVKCLMLWFLCILCTFISLLDCFLCYWFPFLQNLICVECGDEFVLQSQLSLHLEEHRKELSGIKVYTCKTCDKEFKTSAQIKEHMKSHIKMRSNKTLQDADLLHLTQSSGKALG